MCLMESCLHENIEVWRRETKMKGRSSWNQLALSRRELWMGTWKEHLKSTNVRDEHSMIVVCTKLLREDDLRQNGVEDIMWGYVRWGSTQLSLWLVEEDTSWIDVEEGSHSLLDHVRSQTWLLDHVEKMV